jgi:hypothetical protein
VNVSVAEPRNFNAVTGRVPCVPVQKGNDVVEFEWREVDVVATCSAICLKFCTSSAEVELLDCALPKHTTDEKHKLIFR